MEIEKLFVTLALDAVQYSGGLEQAQKEGSSWAGRMRNIIGGGLQKAAMIGSAALIGVGSIVANTAAQGITEFVAFENQMNEVFTLLPGITESAMEDMRGEVLEFSKDLSVLPEKVVPALYQALSAGVPEDNVFEFLETAQKAAVGGITELDTAVDGITSVVNAYGKENMEAARASDVMFTAVRLGKTDFDQLSNNLFNVIPTAASLGISFEEVAAGLATLTAQGTPTAVATTQMRQLFVELSKSGGDLATVIEKQTGSSFNELIDQGMSVAGVLDLVRKNTSDIEFRELFGSVEALNAALGISGPNADMMFNNLDAMAEAAGATDAAFTQMDGGIQRSIDGFRAFAATALIQVGSALSPIIDKALEFAHEVLPIVQAGLETVISLLGSFFGNLDEGMTPLDAFIEAIWDIAPPELLEHLVNFRDNILPGIIETFSNLWSALLPVIETIQTAVAQFVSWEDVMIAVGLILGGVIVAAIANIVIALAPVVLAVGLVIAIIATLRNAWVNDWGGIASFIQEIAPQIQEIVTTFIQFIQALWLAHGEEIKATILGLWEAVSAYFSTNLEAIKELVRAFIALFQGDWEGFVEHIYNSFRLQVEALVLLVARLWFMIAPKLTALIENIKQKFNDIDWEAIGTNIMEGIANGITAAASFIADAAKEAALSALDAAKSALGIGSPSKVAEDAIGIPIPMGIARGIWRGARHIDDAMSDVLGRAIDASGRAGVAGAGVANNNATSYSSQTTVQLPNGADPMRALRASRHLDRLGRAAT